MVTSKETRAAITALHQKWPCMQRNCYKDIAPKRTIYRIIKNFKERGLTAMKKSSGRPRVSSKCQDGLLLRSQLRNHVTSSAELAQEWQQVGVRASARTVRPRLWDSSLVSRRAAKKPLLSKKNVTDRLKCCRKYKDWTAEDLCKVIFSDEAPFRLFGTSEKSIVQSRKGECYHESCDVPTVKHLETIHVWGCFSTKGVLSHNSAQKLIKTSCKSDFFQRSMSNLVMIHAFSSMMEHLFTKQE
uniref:Transposase Tc1-like domain-containing protein n=1 Tax=Cyprinus carpio carpio TaxID=630221 RepID=A0A9J7XH37_CYPCA